MTGTTKARDDGGLAKCSDCGRCMIADDVADDKMDSQTIRAIIGNKEAVLSRVYGGDGEPALYGGLPLFVTEDRVQVRVAPSELSTDVTEEDDESGGNIWEENGRNI
ncbi:hypothetical protein ISCGN_022797 [Ixodes scapularis]